MRYLAFLLLLLTAPALAQEPGGAAPASYAGCDSWYPNKPIADGEKITTLLSVHVGENGWISNPAVAQSSGDADFDAAALACAPHMVVHPVMQNKQLAAIDWQIEVRWYKDGHSSYSVPLQSIACRMDSFIRRRPEPVLIAFHIGPDGWTHDVTLIRSSGRADPDDVALNCVGARRYPPPMQNGHAVDVESETVVYWD